MKKGINFTPITKGNYFTIKNDIEQFTRKLKVGEIFWNKENKDKSLLRSSTPKPITSKNEELNNLIRTIESLEPDNVTQEDNFNYR